LLQSSAILPPRQEGQPFEQLDVLLVLQQRAMQGRDELVGIFLAQRFTSMSSDISSFSQSSSSLVDGFFFRPGTSRIL
jgi:hypothetical protein